MEKTVLCIDDTPLLLELYKRIFHEQRYNVLLASNAWDGLQILRSRSIDCVVPLATLTSNESSNRRSIRRFAPTHPKSGRFLWSLQEPRCVSYAQKP
jgi:CheY-like chemotaxis protein